MKYAVMWRRQTKRWWHTFAVGFEPRDFWVGLYWTTERGTTYRLIELWLCLVPMVPILYRRVGTVEAR